MDGDLGSRMQVKKKAQTSASVVRALGRPPWPASLSESARDSLKIRWRTRKATFVTSDLLASTHMWTHTQMRAYAHTQDF